MATHGTGKATTSLLLQSMLHNLRVLDAEKAGEVLMDINPGLQAANNFQHREPWRPLGVETARQKISAGSRFLVVGDSLDPIHSLVGKLGAAF